MNARLRFRAGAGLAVAAAVLLAVATVGAVQLQSDDRSVGPDVPVPAGSSSVDEVVAADAVPTTPSLAAGSDTAPPTVPVAEAAPSGAAPAAAQAAALPANPPLPPPGPGPAIGAPPAPAPPAGLPPLVAPQGTFTISPTTGPGNTRVTASGTGCTGLSARVSIRIDDPAGLPYGADAGSPSAGGAWSFPFSISGSALPGVHTVTADCRSGAQVLFVYPPQAFTVIG